MNHRIASIGTSWLSVMVATGLLMPTAFGQRPNSAATFAVTMEKFASLSEDEQLSLLATSVTEWKAGVANFSARLQVDVENRNIDPENNRPSDTVLQATDRREWSIRRIGNSYRIKHQTKDRPDESNSASKESFTGYDAANGERRSFTDYTGDRPDWAAVGTEHTQMLMDCPLMALIGARKELMPVVSLYDVASSAGIGSWY